MRPIIPAHSDLRNARGYTIFTRKNNVPREILMKRGHNDHIFHLYCMGEKPAIIARSTGEKLEGVNRVIRLVAREAGVSIKQVHQAHKQARENMLEWAKKNRDKVLQKEAEQKQKQAEAERIQAKSAKRKLAIARNMKDFKGWLKKNPAKPNKV